MWCALVDGAVLREWLVNIGGRQADQRLAHLFCELLLRLEAVGRVTDNSYAFPFTQRDVADTMGLSDVQVSRSLRELRALGLIHLKRRVLTILDVERLKAYCGFNPNYLHLRNARWSGRRQVPWLSGVQVDSGGGPGQRREPGHPATDLRRHAQPGSDRLAGDGQRQARGGSGPPGCAGSRPAGAWYMEVGFGRLAGVRAPLFDTPEDATRWVRQRLKG